MSSTFQGAKLNYSQIDKNAYTIVREIKQLSTMAIHLGDIFICLVLISHGVTYFILINLGLLGDFWLIYSQLMCSILVNLTFKEL